MKFCYVDESGDRSEGDTFVMTGLLVDAYRLRRKTQEVDQLIQDVLGKHPGTAIELKTKAFMRGKGGWSAIPLEERKELLTGLCRVGIAKGDKIYGIAISISAFDAEMGGGGAYPFGNSFWVCSAMFISSLIQKKMQTVIGKKGLTALVVDDNKIEMPKLSGGLFAPDHWYDGLYQVRNLKGGWTARTDEDRFDQIINTGFAINSEHSSLVQVSDSIAWVFRRHLELTGAPEGWAGEKGFYTNLAAELEGQRIRLGQTAPCHAVDLYSNVRHDGWSL